MRIFSDFSARRDSSELLTGNFIPRARRLALAICLLGASVGGAPLALAQESGGEVASMQSAVLEVNINTAGAAELAERLSGIGMRRAEAIVRYREQFGLFESVEELAEVGGVGEATVERNRELIRLR